MNEAVELSQIGKNSEITRRDFLRLFFVFGAVSAGVPLINACTSIGNEYIRQEHRLDLNYPEMDAGDINQVISVVTPFSETALINLTQNQVSENKLRELITTIESKTQTGSELFSISLRPQKKHLIFLVDDNDPYPYWNESRKDTMSSISVPEFPTLTLITAETNEGTPAMNALRTSDKIAIETCQAIIHVDGEHHNQEMFCNALGLTVVYKAFDSVGYEQTPGLYKGFDPRLYLTAEEFNNLPTIGLILSPKK